MATTDRIADLEAQVRELKQLVQTAILAPGRARNDNGIRVAKVVKGQEEEAYEASRYPWLIFVGQAPDYANRSVDTYVRGRLLNGVAPVKENALVSVAFVRGQWIVLGEAQILVVAKPTATGDVCEINTEINCYPGTVVMDSTIGTYSGSCWIKYLEAADPVIPIWGDHPAIGYFAGHITAGAGEAADTRPQVIIPTHPITSVFGEWTASSGTSGTTGSIAVRRTATDLLDYSASAESPFGAISNGKLVKADNYPGYGFMAVATEC